MKGKRGQSAFEFLVATAIATVFFTLLAFLVISRTNDFSSTQTERYAKAISDTIDKEIIVAKKSTNGYIKNFNIPSEIGGEDFSFKIKKGKELVIYSGGEKKEYLIFLSDFVVGELSTGDNKIMKLGDTLGFCYEEDCSDLSKENQTNWECYCNDVFPTEIKKKILCEPSIGLWEDCDFSFGDKYYAIRVECDNRIIGLKNATLTLTIPDHNLIKVNLTRNDSDDGINYGGKHYIEFKLKDFLKINRSGTYNFDISCNYDRNPNLDYKNSLNVPYGHFEIERKGIPQSSTSCKNVYENGVLIENRFECKEDEEFDITYTVKCLGGECGNVNLWLDPK